MKSIIKYTFSIILIVFTFNLKAQITTTLSTNRNKTDLDIGFNRRSDKGIWWTDNTFIDRLAEMNPDILRYPGGTQANYWDWTTGKFLDSTNKTWNNKEVLHIPEFLNALPNRTKVIYVVNMARPTPATGISVNASEEILKSNATLNAKIQDMLNAIAEFEINGKLPYAIELGNEFFFGNEESGIFQITEESDGWHSGWDYANNQSFVSVNNKNATEINAKFYLDQCKDIVSTINSVYPSIKFALVASKKGNGNSVRDRWNNTIFDELTSNPKYTNLQSHIYAITQHHYLSTNYGDQTVIFDNTSAKVAIAEGIQYPIDKQEDYDIIPNNYKIWYTEYGISKNNAVETWATALRYGALIISWLNRGDKVGQLDYHYVSKNDVIKTGSPMKLAPIGIAAKLFALASGDMSEMQEIIFNNNPISVNGIKSLYGYKFKNNEKETLFIININNSDLQVETSNLFTYNGQYTKTQYYSNAPYISSVYLGHSNIISNISSVNTNSFTAKNFSITTIEVANSELSTEDNNIDKISVYPNPVTNIILIDTPIITSKNIVLIDISGKEVSVYVNKTNNSIDVSDLKAGIYFLKTKHKIIKIIKL
jgi:hypothetical protein